MLARLPCSANRLKFANRVVHWTKLAHGFAWQGFARLSLCRGGRGKGGLYNGRYTTDGVVRMIGTHEISSISAGARMSVDWE
jgi:hypothetical protein